MKMAVNGRPEVCMLKDCITNPELIEKFLKENPDIADKNKADYVLIASQTHLLYKYESVLGVWYVHYGPNTVFKICVYKKEL
jgi:hypothetical protein